MFIFELWFFFTVVLPVLAVLGVTGIYKTAPLEWKETSKRAALVIRSNIGSTKAKTVLAKEKLALNPYVGDDSDEVAKAEWTAKFTGQELMLVNKDNHQIVKSWNELNENIYDGTTERWYWECNCGEKDHRKTKEASKNAANRHIKTYGGRDSNGIKDYGWLR